MELAFRLRIEELEDVREERLRKSIVGHHLGDLVLKIPSIFENLF